MARKSGKQRSTLIGLGIALSLVPIFVLAIGRTPRLLVPIRNSRFKNLAKYWNLVAKVESANFSSNLYTKYGNPWGMGCVKKRPTTQTGCTTEKFEGMSKGIYSNDYSAGEDIVLYMDYFNYPENVESLEEFANLLKQKGYYTTSYSNYLKALKSWQ